MRKLTTWSGLLVAGLLILITSAACNVDDAGEEQPLIGAGESCTEDERCASGLCLSELDQCADTCSESEPCSGSDVCTSDLCVPYDYCDEGFGPGCPPTECTQDCGDNAYCNRQAENGAACQCDTGFEGDGFNCLPEGFNPCTEDNGGCGNPDVFVCIPEEDADSGVFEATCALINPCLEENGQCGDSDYYACENPQPGVADCSLIDLCVANNGSCGDPEVFQCTTVPTEDASEVQCARVNPCTEDNGGCGDADQFLCLNPEPTLSECVLVNPCTEDNGGCGDPTYTTCENPAPGEVECGFIDLCETNNGGCGPAEAYACVPNPGADPGCWYVGGCEETLTFEPLLQASIDQNAPSFTSGDEGTLLNPTDRQTNLNEPGITRGVYNTVRSLYAFDVNIAGFELADFWSASLVLTTRVWNTYSDLPPLFEVLFSESDWDSTVTWNTQPSIASGQLATMTLDTSGPPRQTLRNDSRTIALALKESISSEDMRLSVMIRSLGLAALFGFGGNLHGVTIPGPSLELRFLTCDHVRPAPVANASVSRITPNVTYTPGSDLVVDGDRGEAFLRFDVQAPSGAVITNARLELTTDEMSEGGEPLDFIVDYSSDNDWSEDALTYDSRPTAQNTELGRFTLDPEHVALGAQTVAVETFELTEAVREGFENGGQVTLRIAADGGGSARFFDRTAREDRRPILRVIYE